MNRLTFAAAVLAVLCLAAWTYNVNYRAADAARAVERLRADLAETRQDIAVLEAEWAYLNAPERLSALVAAHRERLGGLAPASPVLFGEASAVPFPERPAEPDPVALALAAAARSILTQHAGAEPAPPAFDPTLLPVVDPERLEGGLAGLEGDMATAANVSFIGLAPEARRLNLAPEARRALAPEARQ